MSGGSCVVTQATTGPTSTAASRRFSLTRQMALRTSTASMSSTDSADLSDGFAVRSGHLAPPVQTPDSPRPQKNAASEPFAATLTVPAGTAASSTKPPSSSTADGK
ncbi:hypothetical protein Ddc_05056 [Ditylenchus destructor]|nr:hypothetical protein Ddc_05056 [Ditylenchus destructor]